MSSTISPPTATTANAGIAEIATSAEIITATDTTRIVTAAALLAAQGFTTFKESAETALVDGSNTNVAHTQSRTPKLAQVWVRCKTAEFGYSVGDEVQVGSVDIFGGSQTGLMITKIDSTNVRLTQASNGIYLINASTFAGAVLTNANWRSFVRTWA